MQLTKEEKQSMVARLASDIVTILSVKKVLMLAARGGVANVLEEFRKSLDSLKETDYEIRPQEK